MLAMRCAAGQGFARCDATICPRATAQDSPGYLGGYRSGYPAPLLGCVADIQGSEASEDVGGCEVRYRTTGLGPHAAPARATADSSRTGASPSARFRRLTISPVSTTTNPLVGTIQLMPLETRPLTQFQKAS